MPVSVSTLSVIPLFSDLDPSEIAAIANAATTRSYAAKQQILQGAVLFQHLIVVISGQVQSLDQAPDGRLIGLSHASAGDTIGWLPIIDGEPVKIDLSAATNTELLFIPAQVARTLATTRPIIAERVLKGLAANIRRLTNERLALTQPNAFQRIFVHILNLTGENTDAAKPTALPKQHEIAAMANTSRETVSRALQILVKNGILKKSGHTVVIQKQQALEQLANDGPSALNNLKA